MKKQSKALKILIITGKLIALLVATAAAILVTFLLTSKVFGSDTPKQSPKETLAAEKAVFTESEKVND